MVAHPCLHSAVKGHPIAALLVPPLWPRLEPTTDSRSQPTTDSSSQDWISSIDTLLADSGWNLSLKPVIMPGMYTTGRFRSPKSRSALMHGREERCAWPLMYGAHGGWMVEELKGASRASMAVQSTRCWARCLAQHLNSAGIDG